MKYMTFNSSCSYAGIANMLEQYGIDTTDREIALGMKLPYLFVYDDGAYVSGPMLQKAEWFDIYLNSIGFQLIEKKISADKVVDYLKDQKTAMLGIKMENVSEIIELCNKEVTVEYLQSKLNTLFRPLFLDGITMLNLIGETEFADEWKVMQGNLLGAIRADKNQCIQLGEYISTDKLQVLAQRYVELIRIELEKEKLEG